MHLPVEMIRQPPIIIQSTQIGSTDIADLQFLMPRGTRGVGEGFKFALFILFGGLCDVDLVEFRDGGGDGAGFAEDGDFKETSVDGTREVGDLFKL